MPAAAASAPAEESREAEGATEDAAPKKAAENGTNGDSADHQHVNGKSASNPEADCNYLSVRLIQPPNQTTVVGSHI